MILRNNPGYFKKFSVVIATDEPEDQLLQLAALLPENNTPLLVSRAIMVLHLVVASHKVVESHPNNYHEDLRLNHPFPALQDFMESIDLGGADNTKHGNIPYLVVLFKYLEQLKGGHDGQFPSNYREKKACI